MAGSQCRLSGSLPTTLPESSPVAHRRGIAGSAPQSAAFRPPQQSLSVRLTSSESNPRRWRVASADPRSRQSGDYNVMMKEQMGWEHVSPFEYHYDRGLYYHEVEPGVLCGSQPRNVEDVEYLALEEKVTTILNLQQDRDLDYWGVDIHSLSRRCHELGVNLVRCPARDFDGDSLREVLPRATRALHEALEEPNALVYVHCTAGLGRSPGVCIAHMFWFGGFGDLDTTYKCLTDVRPCGPKREAIRGATFDILSGQGPWDFGSADHMDWTSLTEEQKSVLRYNVMRAL